MVTRLVGRRERATPQVDGSTCYDLMVIFSKRKALAAEAAARGRGENVDYITRTVPPEFRMKLWFAVMDSTAVRTSDYFPEPLQDQALGRLHGLLCRAYGRGRLYKGGSPATAEKDLEHWVLREAPGEELMDLVELVPGVLQELVRLTRDPHGMARRKVEFVDTVRRALGEHKLAWDLVDGQVVERDSARLHADVVAPALTLLHGRKRFAAAEAQIRDALNELADRKWADAITDANAAVEIVLRTIVGFDQGQLPGLLAEARRRGIFGEQEDRRLKKVVDGFTALSDMRNEEGDAHGNAGTRESAWLAVHWAAALIVFIVERAEALRL